ncbi:hypothetical protein GW17_00015763, partial [Ensete ventricosum]
RKQRGKGATGHGLALYKGGRPRPHPLQGWPATARPPVGVTGHGQSLVGAAKAAGAATSKRRLCRSRPPTTATARGHGRRLRATVTPGRGGRPRQGRIGQPRGQGYHLQGRSLAGAATSRGSARARRRRLPARCRPRAAAVATKLDG